jgi:NAD(P)-dependent dehydrogenase (short-subunit alcohol dehydrogenase family)
MVDAMDAAAAVGTLDAAILNAGLFTGVTDIRLVPTERYHQVVSANIYGVVNGIQAFLNAVGTSTGSVVVTSSSVGLVPAPHDPIYAMTKHAVIGLVRSLALQTECRNVRINCICPNGVDTPMLADSLKEGRRLLSPDDVAARIIELLRSDSTGDAWVCTPTLFERFEFPPNPGYTFPPVEAASTKVPLKNAPR